MAPTEPEKQISLKLMVNKERNKVVFAEAGKDFVDVLFSFFTLPLGTIVRLVREESNMLPIEVGSLTSLYQSAENLDKEFLCTDSCKQIILRPKNSLERYCMNLKLKIDDTEPAEYFVCNNLLSCRFHDPVLISMFKNRRCRCGKMLDKPISPSTSYDGFVKDSATFIITDDLTVEPNSLNAFFDMFKNCGIESMSSVNEMMVTITKTQVMDLLKSCLISTATLTSLFLEKPYIEKCRKVEFPPFDVNVEGGMKINFLLSNQLLPLYDDFEYFCLTHKYANNYSASDLYLSAYNLTNIFQLENSDFRSITAVDFVDTILTRGNSKGYVKGPTMYMATDDLVVTPMSTTSVISLLSTLSIPFSDLEEKEVTIGIKEGVGILQASLTSKSVLTTALSHLLTEVKQE
ncbi:hypothetical protein DEO72_LG6g1363 [Vigna unguiculata]|nr:hypothetical protein DEO72_LG6g1363 [Vigna unguiculata]